MSKQTDPRRALALVAMLAAAVGSAASGSSEDPQEPWGSWTLTENATGPQILLTSTSGSAEKSVAVALNAEANSEQDHLSAWLNFSVNACMTGDTAGHPTLRILVIPESPTESGEVFERAVPLCPAVEPFVWTSHPLNVCPFGVACSGSFNIVFERRALSTNTNARIDVTWTVDAELRGIGGDDDIAPTGSDLTLEVQP